MAASERSGAVFFDILAIMKERGLLHVYTGDGKGKTTASVGLCVRARSRGMRVLFTQYMKDIQGGEVEALRRLEIDCRVFRSVKSPLFNKGVDMDELRREALKAVEETRAAWHAYDLLVMDEFNIVLSYNLITMDETMDFLGARPEGLEMIVTGRGAPEWLVEMADLVTEMREIKHPARKNVKARQGIEY